MTPTAIRPGAWARAPTMTRTTPAPRPIMCRSASPAAAAVRAGAVVDGRRGHDLEHARDDLVRGRAAQREVEIEQDAVVEHGRRHGLDVVGQDEGAAVEERLGLGGAVEGDARARAAAQAHLLVLARGTDEGHHVLLDRRRDEDRAHGFAHREQRRAVDDRLDLLEWICRRLVAAGDAQLVARDRDSPSSMRTRNRSSCASGSAKVPSSSIGFWVARTRNGIGQWPRLALDRDLSLLHRLEQRDCVRGVARLISSTSRTLVKTGPGTKRKWSPSSRLDAR